MQATIVTTKSISLTGLKRVWKVVRDDETAVCDGAEYLKLHGHNYSLAKLISEGTDVELDKSRIGQRSVGIQELVQVRNEQQAESFMESVNPKAACTLFSTPAERKAKSRRETMTERRDQEDLRRSPQSMTIPVTAGSTCRDVRILRAMHPRDNLFVECEAQTLAHVLSFIRERGFTDSKPKTAELPKGIHRRGDKYQVMYTKDDGSGKKLSGYRCFNDLEEAASFKLELEASPSPDPVPDQS